MSSFHESFNNSLEELFSRYQLLEPELSKKKLKKFLKHDAGVQARKLLVEYEYADTELLDLPHQYASRIQLGLDYVYSQLKAGYGAIGANIPQGVLHAATMPVAYRERQAFTEHFYAARENVVLAMHDSTVHMCKVLQRSIVVIVLEELEARRAKKM